MKTPDEQVAENITDAFVKAKLLDSSLQKGLVAKVVSGRQTSSEWLVLFTAQINAEAAKRAEEKKP